MPLQATSGAASYDAFGGGAAVVPNYIEDVFSCFLYAGTSQPGNSSAYGYLVNNIDLLTKGGMIWTKDRSNNATGTNDNVIVDTLRGTGTWPAGTSNSPYMLKTNTTAAQVTMSDAIQGVTTTGYYIGPGNTGVDAINTLNNNYVSWTFRKQPKFFDIVTYTGNDATDRQISHALGSAPGCIFVKSTSNTQDWFVNHRALPSLNSYLNLNTTAASTTGFNWGTGGGVAPTSTVFTVGDNANVSGRTYVAYLFAHNAGGFGLTGTDNVISCGGFTANGNNTITLGYEPQWVMVRRVSSAGNDWEIYDTMRGCSLTGSTVLVANSSAAEGVGGTIYPTATGFYISSFGSGDIIYIAIRRGPMKVPTTGTSVFSPILQSNANTPPRTISGAGFAPDLLWQGTYQYANGSYMYDRLRGQFTLQPCYTNVESSAAAVSAAFTMDGISYAGTGSINNNGNAVDWFMRRAPGFFDEVCYTGTGSYPFTINHNLGVAPELMIIKPRNAAQSWWTYAKPVTSPNSNWYQNYFVLNGTQSSTSDLTSFTSAPTSTTIPVADYYAGSGTTYVAYLFATCAGVSKVGSYTGNGSTQTIDCGFGAGGARFVLIKRTDSTGDWYVYDTARGMTTLTDPYLLMNSASTGAATLGSVTTVSTGFAVNASVLAAINTNAASYIFLAIA